MKTTSTMKLSVWLSLTLVSTTKAVIKISDSGFLGGHLYERYTDDDLVALSAIHSDSGLTWNQARQYVQDLPSKCGVRAPHLVSITSLRENDFTKLLADQRAFIGLTDQDGYCYEAGEAFDPLLPCEDDWRWLTEAGPNVPIGVLGYDTDFTSWYRKPNGYDTFIDVEPVSDSSAGVALDCAHINWSGQNSGTWTSIPCNGEVYKPYYSQMDPLPWTLDFILEYDCVESRYHNGHYYEMYGLDEPDDMKNWDDARDFAASRSQCGKQGHLVSIDNAEENEFLYQQFTKYSGAQCYIGARRLDSTSPFLWNGYENFIFGEQADVVGYSNWNVDEPANEWNCVTIGKNPLYDSEPHGLTDLWATVGCDSTIPFIVEYDCDDVKAPVIDWELKGLPSNEEAIDIEFSLERLGNEIEILVHAPDPTYQYSDLEVLPGFPVDYTITKSDWATCGSPVDAAEALVVRSTYAHNAHQLKIAVNVVQDRLDETDVFVDPSMEFCLDIQYHWQGFDATHIYARLSFDINVVEGFAVAENIMLETLTDLEEIGHTAETDYLGEAYLCDNSCGSISDPGPFEQGSSVSYCVASNTEGVYVSGCSAVEIIQNGAPDFSLGNALNDAFTDIDCSNSACCRITTILDQRWYLAPNGDQPGDLTISGVCTVGFGSGSRDLGRSHLRTLQESPSEAQDYRFGSVTVGLEANGGSSGVKMVQPWSLLLSLLVWQAIIAAI